MYGSLDVRKFLGQQEEESMRSSGGVPAPRAGEPGRVSPEQVHRARLAVARSADNAEDCKLLLDMLGLTPDEDGEPPVAR
ncbi:hypothetical protein DFQ14_101319 [Halopolyspora algeriensis]|uniref:Uncharacterized protein n=1 Tax=Halopolyspora algeriensis TaxID=1500506 RepID=A0A368VXP6_9ACTN|nr:hypothetical protein [Halopolyspora algeriensis]RCW46976.1 hypothetical protein DFQ14_101319 [Halopolyspora algeriensis]TQM48065.1 hypothetical protein FHU43_3024 [Halopolyspora algeriensis]